jgi:hypothetical protein
MDCFKASIESEKYGNQRVIVKNQLFREVKVPYKLTASFRQNQNDLEKDIKLRKKDEEMNEPEMKSLTCTTVQVM